jgi:hypothetical protein
VCADIAFGLRARIEGWSTRPKEKRKRKEKRRKIILASHHHALFRGLVIGAKLEVMKMQKDKGRDWFYKVKLDGQDYFVAQNETGAYTLMFPEDY